MRIGRFGDIYGHELKRWLEMMLEEDVGRRVGWHQLDEGIGRREEVVVRSARQTIEPIRIEPVRIEPVRMKA